MHNLSCDQRSSTALLPFVIETDNQQSSFTLMCYIFWIEKEQTHRGERI